MISVRPPRLSEFPEQAYLGTGWTEIRWIL